MQLATYLWQLYIMFAGTILMSAGGVSSCAIPDFCRRIGHQPPQREDSEKAES